MASTTVTIARSTTSLLSNPLTVTLTVGGTATFGTDYTVSGATTFTATSATVLIPANQTQAVITLTSVADTVIEPDETVILTLAPTAGVSSGTGSVTWTILNDDAVVNPTLLMHFDGVSGGTTFVDSALNPVTGITMTGTAQLNTISKFGGTSLYIEATNSTLPSIIIPASAKTNLSTGDFTLEFFIRAIAPVTLSIRTNNWGFNVTTAHVLLSYNGGSNFLIQSIGVSSLNFKHIALTRAGDNHLVFLDGFLASTTVNTNRPANVNSNCIISTGVTSPSGGCYLDEFRIIKGVALYTANFTPPTAAFT